MGRKGTLKEVRVHGLDYNKKHRRVSNARQAHRGLNACQPYLGKWPQWKVSHNDDKYSFELSDNGVGEPTDQTAWRDAEYPFQNLVFNAGGTRLMAYIGALSALEDAGVLNVVRRFSGCSSGALIATLLAIGCTPQEMIDVMVGHRPSYTKWLLRDKNLKILCLMPKVYQRYGLSKMRRLYKVVGQLMERKVSNKHITFKQLQELHEREVVIVAANVTKMRLDEFSAENTPHMAIREALKLALAIPGLYEPARVQQGDEEVIYVDGSILNDYPLHVFDDDDIDFSLSSNHTLGMFVFSESQRDISTWRERYGTEPPEPRRPTERTAATNKYRQKSSSSKKTVIGLRSKLRKRTKSALLSDTRHAVALGSMSVKRGSKRRVDKLQDLAGIMNATIRTMKVHQKRSTTNQASDVQRTVPINCGYLDGTEIIFGDDDKRYMLDQGYQQTKLFLMEYSRKYRGVSERALEQDLPLITQCDIPSTADEGRDDIMNPPIKKIAPLDDEVGELKDKLEAVGEDKESDSSSQGSDVVLQEAQQKALSRLSFTREITSTDYLTEKYPTCLEENSSHFKDDASLSTVEIGLDDVSSVESVFCKSDTAPLLSNNSISSTSISPSPVTTPDLVIPSGPSLLLSPLAAPQYDQPPRRVVISPGMSPNFSMKSMRYVDDNLKANSRVKFEELRKRFESIADGTDTGVQDIEAKMDQKQSRPVSSSSTVKSINEIERECAIIPIQPPTINVSQLPVTPAISASSAHCQTTPPTPTNTPKLPTSQPVSLVQPQPSTSPSLPLPPTYPATSYSSPFDSQPPSPTKTMLQPEKESSETSKSPESQDASSLSTALMTPTSVLSQPPLLASSLAMKTEAVTQETIITSSHPISPILSVSKSPPKVLPKPRLYRKKSEDAQKKEKRVKFQMPSEDSDVETTQTVNSPSQNVSHSLGGQVIDYQPNLEHDNVRSNERSDINHQNIRLISFNLSSTDSDKFNGKDHSQPRSPTQNILSNGLVSNVAVDTPGKVKYRAPPIPDRNISMSTTSNQNITTVPVSLIVSNSVDQSIYSATNRQNGDVKTASSFSHAYDKRNLSNMPTADVQGGHQLNNVFDKVEPLSSFKVQTPSYRRPFQTLFKHGVNNTTVVNVRQSNNHAPKQGVTPAPHTQHWSHEESNWSHLPSPVSYGRTDLKMVSYPWSSGRPVAPQSAHALSQWNNTMGEAGQHVSLVNISYPNRS